MTTMPTEANTVLSDEQIAEIEALSARVPDGPWFADADIADDVPNHRRSGLALVDTGRSGDWWIARLCEWHIANFIAASKTNVDALCATVKALRAEIITSDQEWQSRLAEVERERNELRAELNSSAESIINEAGKVGQLMDLASANAVKESLDCAIELCKAKAEGYRKSAEGNLARETWMDRADVMDGFARELEALK